MGTRAACEKRRGAVVARRVASLRGIPWLRGCVLASSLEMKRSYRSGGESSRSSRRTGQEEAVWWHVCDDDDVLRIIK